MLHARRRIKGPVPINSGENVHFWVFMDPGFKHKHNPFSAVMFISFSHRSVVSCSCEGKAERHRDKKERSIRAVCWFALKKKKKKGSPKSSSCYRILAGNSLTISTVAVQSARLHPDLLSEAGSASPSLLVWPEKTNECEAVGKT